MSVAAPIVSDMIITCDTCAVRDIGCNDCVLTFLLTRPDKSQPNPICEIPDSTADAIDLLSSRGIVRPLRFNSAQGA
jgi:hypothetical protein